MSAIPLPFTLRNQLVLDQIAAEDRRLVVGDRHAEAPFVLWIIRFDDRGKASTLWTGVDRDEATEVARRTYGLPLIDITGGV